MLYLEGDLLHVLGFLRRVFSPSEGQLMMLGLGVSTEEANAPIQVFIRDHEAHNAAIKISHFHQVVAKKSHVAQPANLRHSVLPCLCGVQSEDLFLALPMLSAGGRIGLFPLPFQVPSSWAGSPAASRARARSQACARTV